MGGVGAGEPGGAGTGNGAGTAAGISTASTFIAVNMMKEDPIAQIAMKRMSVCILPRGSKLRAYQSAGKGRSHPLDKLLPYALLATRYHLLRISSSLPRDLT